MNNKAVVSLAILKVNWDELSQDYLQTFVPIAAECIRLSQSDLVSLQDLQNQLRIRFGLKIPQNSIKSILRRLLKKGFVQSKHGVLVAVRAKLDQLNFHTVQQRVLKMHESVIEHLVRFSSERFDVKWVFGDAENAFLEYIEDHQLALIDYTPESIPLISHPSNDIKGGKYIVGSFIEQLYKESSADFEYLEQIVKGNLLANAVFLPEPSRTTKKFRKTEVYIDTSLLIFALGYAGPARQDPCTELLSLFDENGADLRCFAHTLSEARGVLDACANRIKMGQLNDAYGSLFA